MTTEEKARRIILEIQEESGCDPVRIFKNMAAKDYISIHGPEHHVLDGASILVAFHNAGGKIDLDAALDQLLREGLRMPGAMCGLWGVCGAVTSVGAALSAIDGTGPLTEDGTWGDHMSFTAGALGDLGRVNGPRCCKRDAMIAFAHAVEYINSHYDVTLGYEKQICEFSGRNGQCIKDRCPFYHLEGYYKVMKTKEKRWKCPKCGREFSRQGQDHYCLKPQTIDEYIAVQDEKVRSRLKRIRTILRNAIPDAEERISWSMPTYWKGRNIIHFAAFKKHIGLYPGDEAVTAFSDQLNGFVVSKGTIRLPYTKEIPEALIKEIARWCYSQYSK